MRSPTDHPAALATWSWVAPAGAVAVTTVRIVAGVGPWRSRVPPITPRPRVPIPIGMAPTPGSAPVKVMVSPPACGVVSVPARSVPWTITQPAVSAIGPSHTARVPSTIRLASAAESVSSAIVRPAGTTTAAPVPGTEPSHVAGSDQRGAPMGQPAGSSAGSVPGTSASTPVTSMTRSVA